MHTKSSLQQQSLRISHAGIMSLCMLFFTGTATMSGQRVAGSIDVNTQLQAIATNPTTNRIYVVGNGIVAIDGATGFATRIDDRGAQSPIAVAVNPVTNKIYAANTNQCTSGSITVIDGETNKFRNIPMEEGAVYVAVNPATNKIYASGCIGGIVVIDGATNAIKMIDVIGQGPPRSFLTAPDFPYLTQ